MLTERTLGTILRYDAGYLVKRSDTVCLRLNHETGAMDSAHNYSAQSDLDGGTDGNGYRSPISQSPFSDVVPGPPSDDDLQPIRSRIQLGYRGRHRGPYTIIRPRSYHSDSSPGPIHDRSDRVESLAEENIGLRQRVSELEHELSTVWCAIQHMYFNSY